MERITRSKLSCQCANAIAKNVSSEQSPESCGDISL